LSQESPLSKKRTSDESAAAEWVFDSARAASRLKKWFPDLTAIEFDRLLAIQTTLVKLNRTVNLVSHASLKNVEGNHIADSVLASSIIVRNLVPKEPLYDYGGGNGFPGLVIAVLNPALENLIVEPSPSKAEYLRGLVESLALKNCKVLERSFESLPTKSVANLVTREGGNLQAGMLNTRKYVRKGGRYFHMKGDGWANELARVPSQLFSFWTPSLLGQYRIPEISGDFAVVLTEKISD
jgi:16S rRNA (guanine527-N7)-methyltransferase